MSFIEEEFNTLPTYNDYLLSFSSCVENNILQEAIEFVKENNENYYTIISNIINDSDMMDFQKVSLIYYFYRMCKYNKNSLLIGDDRGLGKTIQSLKVIKYNPQSNNTIIICPSYLKINWACEIEKWLNFKDYIIIKSSKDITKMNELFNTKNNKLTSNDKNILIISYELFARNILDNIKDNVLFDTLILDEIQYIKNTAAKRTKNIVKFINKHIKDNMIIGLSGTPLWKEAEDGYQVFKLFAPDFFPFKKSYVDRYCNYTLKNINGKKFKVITGMKNTDDLGERIRRLLMIRRNKDDVLPQLPPKQRSMFYIELTNEYIKEMSNDIVDMILNFKFSKGMDYLKIEEAIANFKKEVAMTKIDPVVKQIEDIINEGESVVVFFHHRDVGFKLEETLNSKGIKNVLFIGGLNDNERKERLEKFENDCNVFLGSIRACGLGLNLVKANNIIFIEYDSSPNWTLQCEDRCFRMTQTKTVNINYVVVRNTIDEDMVSILINRSQMIDRVMMDNNFNKIDFKDSVDITKEFIKKLKGESIK